MLKWVLQNHLNNSECTFKMEDSQEGESHCMPMSVYRAEAWTKAGISKLVGPEMWFLISIDGRT
jgi:hypothetical protein